MQKTLTALLVTLYLLGGTMASADTTDGNPTEREVVAEIIRDSIGWALTKDRDRLESILAHDDNFFIFHPNWKDTIVGWDAFVGMFDFFMDPRFKATHFDVRDLRINFSKSGDVAWYSAILDDFGEWDGRPTTWKDTRWTGVLERREGGWAIVQMHFSFAADKVLEEAQREETQKEEPPADPSEG